MSVVAGPFEQSTRYWVLAGSPCPTLESGLSPPEQSGSGFGGMPGIAPASPEPVTLPAVPSKPVLSNQQLPVLPGNSSHQKSMPFGQRLAPLIVPCGTSNWSSASGNWKPGGTWPILFPEKWLLQDVESPFSGAPGHETPG